MRSEDLIERGLIRYGGPCQLFVNYNSRRNAFEGADSSVRVRASEGEIAEVFYPAL